LDVKNVNALAPGQPLSFAPNGLTVIYGDNASGKSGYVRILKKVCRARHIDAKIWPNVFNAYTGVPASAKIEFRIDQTAAPTLDWQDPDSGPKELSSISVFDSACASVYVIQDNEVAYAPLGLDLFEKLANTCVKVKGKLEEEKNRLIKKIEQLPEKFTKTEAGRWFNAINANTSETEVSKFASFSANDSERLAELTRILSEESPAKRAAEFRLKIKRYQNLAQRIDAIANSLSGASVEGLKISKANLQQAIQAAELASGKAFESEPLQGVGGEVWRQLWEAAKKYAEAEAYPGLTFPFLDEGARCVLCQQELGLQASDRFRRFEDFVQDKTSAAEKAGRQEFARQRNSFEALTLVMDNDQTLLTELGSDNSALAERIRRFIDDAEKTKQMVLKACETNDWEIIPGLPLNPNNEIHVLNDEIERNAKLLDQAHQPEQIARIRDEVNEFEANKWLSEHLAAIQEEIKRLKKFQLLKRASDATNTTDITIKSKQITDRYVTKDLMSQFNDRLLDIYGANLRVTLTKKSGQRGVLYYSLQLVGCQLPNIRAAEIFSEGEFSAVALAAFLAEISLPPSKSGIIFDDPVCSLDHLLRENVAKLLVELARERQVIVFTHDLFFLVCLHDLAGKEGVQIMDQQVLKEPWGTGVCTADVPWEAAKLTRRVGILRKILQESKAKYKKEGTVAYAPLASLICLRMRQTLERAIEEILMRGIVIRYRRSVQTQKVKDLSKITADDCKLLDDLMAKYSKILHDQREEARVVWPEPQEIEDDINVLENWRSEFIKRFQS
jgi:energy-coupling factor transporter ATP-binding protein EcfA2